MVGGRVSGVLFLGTDLDGNFECLSVVIVFGSFFV